MGKKTKVQDKNFLVLILITILTLVIFYITYETKVSKEELIYSNLINKKYSAKVVSIVDGDTINVSFKNKENEKDFNENIEYKIRLIGVDTPESVHNDKTKNTEEGKIASDYTKERLEGKEITIEFDISPTDKYGRLLAYVWIEDKMYNKELLEEGYAKIMTVAPNVKYSDELKELQEIARENKKGFWSDEIK